MKKIVTLLSEIHPEYDFLNSSDFFEDGYLDSFDLITLVAAMDKEYHIKIKGTDIVPENFCNLQEIRRFIKEYGIENDI
ncbi:acyl carrier protein [Selenomonas sp.]|uniref:acyl carrier protein n=1 Tax=Selenomonas sp. TaxID=2053611 RepID=UPI0025EEAC64|nr:acyl carrier protein [Selenomonas sp.]